MTNINTELFKRYAPKRKIEIIDSLNQTELLAITPATIIRMVREAGELHYRSKRDKRLMVSRERRAGNNWNSWFNGVDLIKNKLYVNLYIQYDNTDTDDCISYGEFMRDNNRFRGTIKTTDRYDNPQTYYYFYDNEDRARAIKSLLLEYVYTKYANKLNI
jgi:hypothetical protein